MVATPRIKVYDLAKELSQDSQYLVEVIQRLGIDVKGSTSFLGSEEAKAVREHFRQSREFTRTVATATAAATSARSEMTEKRVGRNVIRRRKVDGPAEEAPVEAKAAEIKESPVRSEEAPEQTAAPMDQEPEVELTLDVESVVVPDELVSVAPEVEAEPPVQEAPAAPEPVAPAAIVPAKRRFFPSIIKKVATEAYLGEKVGPKVERKARVGAPTDVKKTDAATTPRFQPMKQVEVVAPVTEAGREAARKKTAQRSDAVFRSADFLKRELIHATKKKKTGINRPAMKTQITQRAEHKRVVEMGQSISVAELAKALSVKGTQVVSKLMSMGVTASLNETVDFDTASLLSQEFGYEVKQQVFREETLLPELKVDKTDWKARAPVVTIMGHVDHGKTSLLDYIRKTQIAAGEAGGITQHVGAYSVSVDKSQITFVDTPGHEAFTAMRARGAKVTDIVILVVSAVDGVMPQTEESVSHAKAAGVPIIVALNKMDLPDANPDKVKQALANLGLTPEEWGGETIFVQVSARTGLGIEKLMESILLQAELLELKADWTGAARGRVVESRLEKATGPIAILLVQHGRLKAGDIVVSGTSTGKVRAMQTTLGARIAEAGPSDPVEILGFSEVPSVGEEFVVVESDRVARDLTAGRVERNRATAAVSKRKLTLEELMTATPDGDKELRVLIRTDVQGSTEALKEVLSKFPQDRVRLRILHAATGGITEGDVMLASASRAVILGFNVRPDVKALRLSENEGVEVRTHSIIYDIVEDVKKLLEGLLDSEVKERVIGRAEVRELFSIPKIGTIAGSSVIDGKLQRGCFLRLLRDNRIIYEGRLSSLRRFKDDVKEVTTGYECGIGLENFTDLKPGDQFEAFLKEERKGTL